MNNKTAIVTGASSGIGLGVTLALLERGYRVVAVARDPARARQLRASPDLAIVAGDVGKRTTAERAAAAARDFGGLDLLVNNAGVFMAKPFTDYAEDDFALLMSTNVAGFFHMTQQALRLMAAGKGGHIVNISTSLVTQP
ncbi:MAG TPA: SDR family NAD(P)-dependent oxidoreductase, partial [Polyangiaceae bacterium]|nr:SDR family NAD(P)-dependent oxidoreductase [Polyangiaceae bacterium]